MHLLNVTGPHYFLKAYQIMRAIQILQSSEYDPFL